MRILGLTLAALLIVVLTAMVWQHLRYVNKRRAVLQDHQPLLYPAETFHAVTFLEIEPSQDVLTAVRTFRDKTESLGEGLWIYAGKNVVQGNESTQIGPSEWSAVVLAQYPSRKAYDEAAASEGYRGALSAFSRTYTQGFKRPAALNLFIHQIFLAKRVRQLITFAPALFPLQRDKALAATPGVGQGVQRLLGEKELGAEGIVIVNLQKHGTAEQRASDSAYGERMMAGMAEGGYGIMHMGRAVRVEADHDFDTVILVYYPGVEFFADLLRSTFFQGIIGGKSLGDTQTNITVPILDHL